MSETFEGIMGIRENMTELLIKSLTEWMAVEHAHAHHLKRVPKRLKTGIQERAERMIRISTKIKSIRVLYKCGKPAAMVLMVPARVPRVKGQKSIIFHVDRRLPRLSTLSWVRRQLQIVGATAPRFAEVVVAPKDDIFFRKSLEKAGFRTRYEIYVGHSKKAYKNLTKIKNPPRDLEHLGLAVRPITSKSQLDEVMALQKTISLKSRRHIYFSHTPRQLRIDREEYSRVLSQKAGLLLGVYRGKKILGLLFTFITPKTHTGEATGGFSFFLHPSIQGLGITKTGYLLLLEFLVKNKIQKFYGGTSQPAVQSLAKVMDRQILHNLYVKMSKFP